MLRMLMSTSKGFHAEFNSGTATSSVEHALLSMIRTRPHAFNGWVLRFSDAKYRFSLQLDQMGMHCVTLPWENRCHMHAFNTCGTDETQVYMKIPFIDAYRLAVMNGMKGAMEHRHQFDMKVEDSVNKLMEKFGFEFFTVMESNIDDGIRWLLGGECYHKMAWDHNDEMRRDEFRSKISSLESLNNDIRDLFFGLLILLPTEKKNAPRAEAAVRRLNDRAVNIVACYRTRSVFCPDAMPLDFLPEI